MNIEYIQPLTVAWNRMVQDLFKPFRPGRWFAVGFIAFLVHLGGGGGGNFNLPSGNRGPMSGEQERVLDWIKDFFSHPFGISLIVALVLGILLLVVVFIWLSSRAHFVFLDQVTGRHWRIADPWTRYGTQGNSLFLWKLGFSLVIFLIMLVLIGPAVAYLVIKSPEELTGAAILAVIWAVLVALAMVVPAAYVQCFLHAFVVPLMYRDGIKTNAAWRRFLPLLRAHTGAFILYGLFMFALWVGISIALVIFSCCTCTFCFFMLPYIGSVISLPIPYLFRGLGPSFLSQFGPQYWSWPLDAPDTPSEPIPPVVPAAT